MAPELRYDPYDPVIDLDPHPTWRRRDVELHVRADDDRARTREGAGHRLTY